ncbi:MAG: hypothetical protein AB9836_04635 [Aminipila sp.]
MEEQLNLFDLVAAATKNEPLLKVGQAVWFLLTGVLVTGEIKKIWKCPDHYSYDIEFSNGKCEIFKENDIGIRVFLTNN